MKKFYILSLILFSTSICFSQINYFYLQPDSVFVNENVKTVYVYVNSKKDLSQIIDYNEKGEKIKTTHYTASYDRKTRKNKRINSYTKYFYDSIGNLILKKEFIKDEENPYERTTYHYDSLNQLKYVKSYKGKYETPYQIDRYSYNPYKKHIIRKEDTIIALDAVIYYDKNGFEKRSKSIVKSPTLKEELWETSGETIKVQSKDYSNLRIETIYRDFENIYNPDSKLIETSGKGEIMTKDGEKREFDSNHLFFKYYSNGLLKSIEGYVPYYFKYEFY